MKNLYKVILFVLFLSSGISYAQQQPHFLFYDQNMSVINPAFSGTQGAYLALNYNSVWISIPNSPRSTSIVYNSRINNNAAWGFSALSDRVYAESQGIVSADYSYQVQLSDETYLHLGIKAGAVYNNLDFGKLNRITEENNPILSGVSNYLNPLVGVGAYLKTKDAFLGISTPNFLNTKRYKEVNGIEMTATDLPHLYVTGGISLYISDQLKFEPSVIYRAVKGAPNLVTALGKFNFSDVLILGAGISNSHYLSTLVMFKGISDFNIGYGYQTGHRRVQALNANTHELVIKYYLN